MAKDTNGNGLAYKNDEGSFSVYEMWLDHRVVFEVAVDNVHPELKIYVAKHGDTWAKVNLVNAETIFLETEGRAQPVMVEVGGDADTAPDAIAKQVDGFSVQAYVYSRLPFIMANIFVPKI